MNITNNQLTNDSITILKNTINKKLQYVIHEEFIFNNVSYGVVYLTIGKTTFALTDYYEVKTIFGADEEISVLKIDEYKDEIRSASSLKLTKEEINLTIEKIILVNTTTHIINKKNSVEEYTLLDTQGIIICLKDGYEFAFEKDDFGENISIYRGYNLKEKFENIPNELASSFIKDFDATCSLEFVEV